MMPLMRLSALAAILTFAAGAAQERGQQLLPTPYPQTLGSTAEQITTVGTHYHQHLLPDPVPQTLGPDASGNPHTFRAGYHQQRLIGSPYPRYDGSGGYGAPGY